MKPNEEIETMKNTDIKNSGGMKKGLNHIWLMAVCCGLPIIGLMLIGVFGISSSSLETLLFLVCPIGMGIMMLKMHSSHEHAKGSPCCDSKGKTQDNPENINVLQESVSREHGTRQD